MSTIQLTGTQLEYLDRGQGDPVVLIHGSLGDYRSWELQMDPFAQTYRTIAYSRRYHYPNQCNGDESNYSAALHAEDLVAFMDGLGLESAHIVGHSYGAYTALFLAARHPERVRALVLGEPPVFPLLEQNPEGRALRDDFLAKVWAPARDLLQQGEMKAGIRHFVNGVVAEGAFDHFPPAVQNLILDNACEFKAETSSPDFWTPFTRDDAAQITAPTLLVTGEQSLKMFHHIVDELERSLPNNQRVSVAESTHEIPGGNPAAYNEIVQEFLSTHSG